MTSFFPWPACHLNWTQHSIGISKERNNLRTQCSITVSCHWADKPVEIWNAPCAVVVLQANGKAEERFNSFLPHTPPLRTGKVRVWQFWNHLILWIFLVGVVVKVGTSIVITCLPVFVLGDWSVNKSLLYKLTTSEVILWNQSFGNWLILALWYVIR